MVYTGYITAQHFGPPAQWGIFIYAHVLQNEYEKSVATECSKCIKQISLIYCTFTVVLIISGVDNREDSVKLVHAPSKMIMQSLSSFISKFMQTTQVIIKTFKDFKRIKRYPRWQLCEQGVDK